MIQSTSWCVFFAKLYDALLSQLIVVPCLLACKQGIGCYESMGGSSKELTLEFHCRNSDPLVEVPRTFPSPSSDIYSIRKIPSRVQSWWEFLPSWFHTRNRTRLNYNFMSNNEMDILYCYDWICCYNSLCHMSVVMSHECGDVTWLWCCHMNLVMSHECGDVTWMWWCHVSVVMSRQCGDITWVWWCHVSVVMSRECGDVTWVWWCHNIAV